MLTLTSPQLKTLTMLEGQSGYPLTLERRSFTDGYYTTVELVDGPTYILAVDGSLSLTEHGDVLVYVDPLFHTVHVKDVKDAPKAPSMFEVIGGLVYEEDEDGS